MTYALSNDEIKDINYLCDKLSDTVRRGMG
jgi:hypothetical protein